MTISEHRFDPTILRDYDVRGVVGKTLSAQDAEALGRAFGTVIRRRGGSAAAVGYDGRLSSPELEAALVQGLASAGVDVRRVGRGPTPMLYYATHALPVDGGVMVTGSHNPPDYNGFKMTLKKAAFFGDDVRNLGRIAEAGDFESGRGEISDHAVFDSYVERLAQDYDGIRDLKVAWDAGNGAAGEAMAALTQRLPGRHLLLNETIDGLFPAHHPDPTVEANLRQIKELVLAEGCDLGVAFDGDGDRIGAIDGQGRVLWGDQIMLLMAEDILKQHPGSTFIADVKASQALFDGIAAAGGDAIMWKTGHSLIKSKMAETGALFAGEMSAHLFFADRYYGFDDGLYAAVRLIGAVSRSGRSLADYRDGLPPLVNTPELRFPCAEDRKQPVISEVKKRLAAEGAEVNEIDGVRVKTDDGWWLLRASNTQDVLVARCEAADQAGLARLKAALSAHLEACGLSLPAD
ncbi:MAG: phosphomannomutase/phosphoglucomutase [Kiloniellales bacterium]|nr:phosphomannomutase/phosphoglucomutase [Kiloniellales bacterium]